MNTYPILGRLDGLPHQPPIKRIFSVVEFDAEERMTTMSEVKSYRARVRCNSCFKFSWVTIEAGYDVNHVACGRCQQNNAVVYKLITIKPEHDGPRCAGPCQNSKSGECECSCGGKNHGLHA